jgi:hypothetical protein
VPLLSEFYGIVIYMYFQDHNPPHFHATRTAGNLVEEGRRLHVADLVANWQQAQEPAALSSIEPLQ